MWGGAGAGTPGSGRLPNSTASPALSLSHRHSSRPALSLSGILGDTPFTEGVVSGFLLIFFSELGDKTFFIALLLATKRSRALVFIGTFSALAAMTVISVGLGRTLHALDDLVPALPGPGGAPLPLDDLLAVALLVVFGVKTLAGAADAEETAAGEEEEAAEAVGALSGGGWGPDAATAALLASTFALVFAAEWGDKSFLATIALAAASSPGGVVLGAVAGHGAATALAVTGGSLLKGRLSERTVSYVGGSLFLVFAASTIVDIFRGV